MGEPVYIVCIFKLKPGPEHYQSLNACSMYARKQIEEMKTFETVVRLTPKPEHITQEEEDRMAQRYKTKMKATNTTSGTRLLSSFPAARKEP